ncbi:Auxin Efflux Carrier [Pseudodesulfovibrio mercurii]|uniref:Auxin Efflux Carrier n=1 Tax=Pseudodesulfovibrio mercurii TaxID=641491 RepID=F0JBT8_9BACT|nr:AEC family transporter [Pseudodesulfovibrio mercurii]EGB14331.1 Auxin Efflux Carrier [Pseudodesulfovibrio mercurii]
MSIYARLITSVFVLLGLICFAAYLRRREFIKEEHGGIFAKLVTHATLPALIFTSLARTTIVWSEAWLALIMVVAELFALSLGWVGARLLRLDRPSTGALILVSGFGSSSLLGYALISQVFPGNTAAMTEAVVVSEIGVGPLLFTLGTMIAIYYGNEDAGRDARLKAALEFFRSPIFISVAAGLIWAWFKLPTEGPVMGAIIQALDLAGAANTMMVTLLVGLLLHFKGIWAVALPGLAVAANKLILKPLIIWLPTLAMSVPSWEVQILILEAAMPSALLTVALSRTYGCNAGLASRMVFLTTALGAVTIPIMFELLG